MAFGHAEAPLPDTRLQQAAALILGTAVRALRRHLRPAPELTTATLRPATSDTSDAEVLVATLAAALLLGSLAIYGQWVLTAVVEEKSNRVVERRPGADAARSVASEGAGSVTGRHLVVDGGPGWAPSAESSASGLRARIGDGGVVRGRGPFVRAAAAEGDRSKTT